MIWGISEGNFYGTVDSVILSLQKNLPYSYNDLVDALTLLSKNKWKIPS